MKFYSNLHWLCLIALSCGLLTKYLLVRPNMVSRAPEPIATASSTFALRDAVPSINMASAQPPAQILVSPFEIQQFMQRHRNEEYFSLQELWQKLGVDVGTWSDCSHCTMKLFRFNQAAGEKIMLWFQPFIGGMPRLLFFSRDKLKHTAWKFIGKLDLQDYHWKPIAHRIVALGKYRWLVFKLLVGKGSGYSRTDEDWYEIRADKIIPVLSYPVHAGTYFYPNRESSARILKLQLMRDQPIISIQFSATYRWDEGAEKAYVLWRKTQSATFIRQKDSGVFALQPHKSAATAYEIDMVYGGEGIAPDEIVKYNYKELLNLASGRTSKQKAWLRQFLAVSKLAATPQLNHLENLLHRKFTR